MAINQSRNLESIRTPLGWKDVLMFARITDRQTDSQAERQTDRNYIVVTVSNKHVSPDKKGRQR